MLPKGSRHDVVSSTNDAGVLLEFHVVIIPGIAAVLQERKVGGKVTDFSITKTSSEAHSISLLKALLAGQTALLRKDNKTQLRIENDTLVLSSNGSLYWHIHDELCQVPSMRILHQHLEQTKTEHVAIKIKELVETKVEVDHTSLRLFSKGEPLRDLTFPRHETIIDNVVAIDGNRTEAFGADVAIPVGSSFLISFWVYIWRGRSAGNSMHASLLSTSESVPGYYSPTILYGLPSPGREKKLFFSIVYDPLVYLVFIILVGQRKMK